MLFIYLVNKLLNRLIQSLGRYARVCAFVPMHSVKNH